MDPFYPPPDHAMGVWVPRRALRPRFRRPFPRRGGGGGGGRCAVQNTPEGPAVVDQTTGEFLGWADEMMGADPYGAPLLAADDGDDMADEIEVTEILGAADGEELEADQAFLAYTMGAGNMYALGASQQKLEARIEKINDKIEDLRDKSANMRGLFQQKRKQKLARRISKLVKRRSKLQTKLSRINAANQDVQAAAATALAPAAVSAGGAAGASTAAAITTAALTQAAVGGPAILDGRDAITKPLPPAIAPGRLAQFRRQQAAQGLYFQAEAPPGSGRLNGVSFYPAGSDNPRTSITVPAGLISASQILRTGNLPYLLSKIVGFVTRLANVDPNAIGMVRGLQIIGGTSLFLSNGWQDASSYGDLDNLRGLRAYPKLQTTNEAQVEVAAAGDVDDVVTLTAELLVDVIADDTYGTGFPGTYAG